MDKHWQALPIAAQRALIAPMTEAAEPAGPLAEAVARNVIMGCADGCVRDVYGCARESLRGHGCEGAAAHAAAVAMTRVYVDAVAEPESELHRWGLMVAAGAPATDALRGAA